MTKDKIPYSVPYVRLLLQRKMARYKSLARQHKQLQKQPCACDRASCLRCLGLMSVEREINQLLF